MHLLRNSSKKRFFFKSDLRPKFYSSNRNKEKSRHKKLFINKRFKMKNDEKYKKIFIESLSIDPKNFKDSIEYNEIPE